MKRTGTWEEGLQPHADLRVPTRSSLTGVRTPSDVSEMCSMDDKHSNPRQTEEAFVSAAFGATPAPAGNWASATASVPKAVTLTVAGLAAQRPGTPGPPGAAAPTKYLTLQMPRMSKAVLRNVLVSLLLPLVVVVIQQEVWRRSNSSGAHPLWGAAANIIFGTSLFLMLIGCACRDSWGSVCRQCVYFWLPIPSPLPGSVP